MARAERLLALMQVLRRHRRPVAGSMLASTLSISLRTLYRDIAALQAQGALIDGAPGVGYVLRPGHTLPPLMFTQDEIEALVLGARYVAGRAEFGLAESARDAIAKIAAVLPPDLRRDLETSAILAGPRVAPAAASEASLALIRTAIRNERKVAVRYRDLAGEHTERTLWPFALAYFDAVEVLVAYCELRAGFRHFRTDGLESITALDERYPERRQVLLARWRAEEGIDAADRI